MTAGEGSASAGWLAELEASRALTRGHFRLSSGLHSPAYVQCAGLLEDPRRARRAGEALAAALVARLGAAPDSVLAPAMGGLLIGHETAAALGVPFRFTERAADGAMALRRGFALAPGERLVVVEDVVTTGKSTRETIDLAAAAGARAVAVGAILDRSGGAPFDAPFVALARLDLPTWTTEECPLCAAGQPVEKPGSRPDPPR
ncbi:MAG TPA: orotate phosphoribosyltransferase [Thermoanaerobaculia bacterium]|nr:orotate phosphoribosyltransferase [Thermoanaerobaculia bacterium]